MKMSFLQWLAAALILPAISPGETASTFEGKVFASLVRDGRITNQFLFTRKANQLRIEDADTSNPSSIDLVQLDSGQVTILFPANATFVRVAPAAQNEPGRPSMSWPFLAGSAQLPTAPLPGQPGAVQPALPIPRTAPPTRPNAPPTVPPAPAMVTSLAPGVGFLPAGSMPLPAMPMTRDSELRKSDTNRIILGFECALFTLTNRQGTMEIWAMPDSALFPFRLLEQNFGHPHFGPALPEEQWVTWLQKKSLFPLQATVRNAAGAERLFFKVASIDKRLNENSHRDLFVVPETYSEIQAPPF